MKTPKKTSLLGRICKVIALLILLGIIALSILFYLFPPREMIRKGAEYAASNILGVEVHIASLHINPLKGFEIKGISIAKEPHILSVKEIVFDYDLKKIWKERIVVINTLHVDTPKLSVISEKGVWNFDPIIKKFAGKGKPPAKIKEEKPAKEDTTKEGRNIVLPHIPVRIEIKDVAISNAELIFKEDEKLSLSYKGLNIKLSGEIDNSYNRFLLSVDSVPGGVENLSIAFKDKSLSFNINAPLSLDIKAEEDNLENLLLESRVSLTPVNAKIKDNPSTAINISTEVDLSLSLKNETIDIKSCLLKIDDNKLFLTGAIKDIFQIPSYDIKISDSNLSFGYLYKKIAGYIPKYLEVINIKGELFIPSIHVSGTADYKNARYPIKMSSDIALSAVDIDIPLLNVKIGDLSLSSLKTEGVISLKDKMHNLKISGASALSDLNATLPKWGISALGINLSSDIKELEIKGVLPVYVNTTAEFSAKKIDWKGEYILSDIKDSLSVTAKGDIFAVNLLKNNLSLKIDSIIPKTDKKIKIYASSKTLLSANTRSGDIAITELSFDMQKPGASGDIFSMKGSGSVTGWGKTGFAIDAYIRKIDIEKSVGIIPPQILKGFGVFPYKGEGNIKIKATGRIPTKEEIDSLAIPVDLTSSVNLKGVDIAVERGLGVGINNLDLSIEASHKNMGDIRLDGAVSIGRVEKESGISIGSSAAEIKVSGRIPKKEEIDSLHMPLDISSKVRLTGADISLEDSGVDIDNMKLSLEASYKNMGDILLNGDIYIGGIHKDGGIAKRLAADIPGGEISFSYRLDEENALTLENIISTNTLGIKNKISGKISGLNSILIKREVPTIKDILKDIMTDIKVSTDIDLSRLKGVITGLPEGVKIEGNIKQYAALQLIPDRSISINGGINFTGVNIDDGKIVISSLSGDIPFKKGLTISSGPSSLVKEEAEIWRKGFFANTRPYSEHFENLSIKDITYKGFKAQGIDIDIDFNETSLSIDKFIFDILGGSSGGSLYLKSKPPLTPLLSKEGMGVVLSLNLEYAQIDLGRLLKGGDLIPDAKIDGNINIDTGLAFKEEKIDIDHMVLYINITKIGDAAFDALLKSLDPEESKPGVMNARAALKYASPYMVGIKIKNGLLSVKLKMKSKTLGGKIIDIPAIERIPFASILNLNRVTDTINSLGWIKGVLRYISADRVEDILPD